METKTCTSDLPPTAVAWGTYKSCVRPGVRYGYRMRDDDVVPMMGSRLMRIHYSGRPKYHYWLALESRYIRRFKPTWSRVEYSCFQQRVEKKAWRLGVDAGMHQNYRDYSYGSLVSCALFVLNGVLVDPSLLPDYSRTDGDFHWLHTCKVCERTGGELTIPRRNTHGLFDRDSPHRGRYGELCAECFDTYSAYRQRQTQIDAIKRDLRVLNKAISTQKEIV